MESIRPKILIVDDEPDIVDAFSIVFREALNAHVRGITQSNLVLPELKSFEPHIMITCILMPEPDGYELCVLAKKAFPKLPILVCSAKDDQASLDKAFALGVEDYIIKPANMEEMVEKLKGILITRYPEETFRFDKTAEHRELEHDMQRLNNNLKSRMTNVLGPDWEDKMLDYPVVMAREIIEEAQAADRETHVERYKRILAQPDQTYLDKWIVCLTKHWLKKREHAILRRTQKRQIKEMVEIFRETQKLIRRHGTTCPKCTKRIKDIRLVSSEMNEPYFVCRECGCSIEVEKIKIGT